MQNEAKTDADKVLNSIARLRQNIQTMFPQGSAYRTGYEAALDRIEDDIKRGK